ncbi:SDR family NAD(P)-dependent oxidoreductase [Haloplanus litoreus]|uniref:SDR family NAD(P)-dependent oxidoreductase n=1 Tax=Haloplanus litoreus TaxID=767515 RepID=UPI00361C3189
MSSDDIEATIERAREASRRDDLDGKVAIVTGAGTRGGDGVGNGAATAILLARQGAKVTLVDKEPEWMEITERIIEEEGGDYLSLEGDVTDPDDCRRIVEETVSRFGALHVLHNNVGGEHPGRASRGRVSTRGRSRSR